MRKWPVEAPEPTLPRNYGAPSGECRVRFAISTITPMVGGGITRGVVDRHGPVHGNAVRGHLRFWWRSICGQRYASVEDLKKHEAAIWGSQAQKSKVTVHIRDVRPIYLNRRQTSDDRVGLLRELTGLARLPLQKVPNENPNSRRRGTPFSPLSYVCFPFRDIAQAAAMVSFTLELSYPRALADDVHAAVWGWVTFGGIGARTRRGMGALFCEQLVPVMEDSHANWIQPWIREKLTAWEIQPEDIGSPRAWPVLTDHVWMGRPQSVFGAWEEAVSLLYEFRQGPTVGRQGNRGHSRWPEPDTLRDFLRSSNRLQHPRLRRVNENGFPRALFGLPIIFRFRDRREPTWTLTPKGTNRMASPIVLRPLVVQFQGRFVAVPMMVHLSAPQPSEWKVRCKEKSQSLGLGDVVHPRLARYNQSPMRGRTETGNSLEAFEHFVQEKWLSKRK
ncbi:MAG: type III-B CRISPR module RAMP protein Cmr1 [Alicyclobacillus sp.]|nr:type III-B CRISPR module RAMP protein Cmr1 [Alicyclobacillus sp.]